MSSGLSDESTSSPNYPELLDRARRHEHGAFTILYETTSRRVFGYLLARLGEPATAEDLLQDVFLAALQGIERFRGRTEGEYFAWILTIARAKLADRLRQRYRHPEVMSGDLESTTSAADPLAAVDQHQRIRELSDALSRLSPDQRDVVVSRMVMGLDLQQTARVLRKNVGSIKALQHRALARLARILREGEERNA